jgi:DNA excision repair protein ERCC-5
LNKQGDLNEFFDISSGSGTRAPRQRQAYASRRLQQVISDFRKQKSGSATPGSRSSSRATSRVSGSGNESDQPNDPELPVAKKRKTIAKPSARGKRVRRSSRSRGSRKSWAKSGVDATEQDIPMSDGDGEFVIPQNIAKGEVAGERELRPRVKPRPAYRDAKERQEHALVANDERL